MNDFVADGVPDNTLSRRQFLIGSALVGSLWASSSALLALAPSPVWALELKNLDERTGRALLAVTRQICPHATLDDAVYALVVKDLDAAAATAEVKKLLVSGLKELDTAAGGDWLALDDAGKLAKVTANAMSCAGP